MAILRMLLVLVLMLLSFQGRTSGKETISPVFRVQVQVDAQGHVSIAQPMQSLKEPYAAIVQRTLTGWRFHPAVIGGKAVVTTTWISVALESRSMPNGDLSIWVKYFGNGPSLGDLALPYPSDMIRTRQQASLLFEATVETDGHLQDVQVVNALTTNGWDAASFVKSARDALGKAHVHPILVDGQPIASHIRLPITYTLDGMSAANRLDVDSSLKRARDSSRFVSKKAAASVDDELQNGAVIALDSPVTPVAAPAG